MRVMSKKQEEVLHQLVRLAKGDFLLVERAMREAGREEHAPTLEDMVSYIKSATTHRRRA
jgi:hypothetical protein